MNEDEDADADDEDDGGDDFDQGDGGDGFEEREVQGMYSKSCSGPSGFVHLPWDRRGDLTLEISFGDLTLAQSRIY